MTAYTYHTHETFTKLTYVKVRTYVSQIKNFLQVLIGLWLLLCAQRKAVNVVLFEMACVSDPILHIDSLLSCDVYVRVSLYHNYAESCMHTGHAIILTQCDGVLWEW